MWIYLRLWESLATGSQPEFSMTQVLQEDDEGSNNSETEPSISVTIVQGRVKSMFIGASGGRLATVAFASLNHGFQGSCRDPRLPSSFTTTPTSWRFLMRSASSPNYGNHEKGSLVH